MSVRIGDAVLLNGDCLEQIALVGPVDLVLADPPYGTTAADWDVRIPFADMWQAIGRVTSKGTPVVLCAAEPFASHLRLSNERGYKYDWIWHKPKATGFLNAKRRPLVAHENVCVFSDGQSTYFPQKTTGHPRKTTFRSKHLQTEVYGQMSGDYRYDSTERYPRSVVEFRQDTQNSSEHSTQKPVGMMEYFVRTFCPAGGTVLDFCMGSGTTGVAALREGRKFIGIEKNPEFFQVACRRIRAAHDAVIGEAA